MLKKKLYLILLFLFILMPNIHAIGVGSFTKNIGFYPNLNENYEAFVVNNVGLDIKVKLDAYGDLAEYVTFPEEYLDIPAGGKKFFTFNLKLPETIRPGTNRLMIGATDVTPPPPGSGGIRAVTAAYKAFVITSPYPGKYLDIGFSASDAAETKPVTFSINLLSRGTEAISRIYGTIEVFNEQGSIGAVEIEEINDIGPGESRTIYSTWDSKGYKSGDYMAKATINYDNNQSILEAQFKIGTLFLEITNYTKEAYQGEINKIGIEIKSLWNTEIKDVYGEMEIASQTINTMKTDLSPWGKTTLIAYWDASDVAVGDYIAQIRIYYEGKSMDELAKITVLPRREGEKKAELPFKAPSVAVLLVIIIILLVVGNIFIVIFLMKKRRGKEKNNNPKNKRNK